MRGPNHDPWLFPPQLCCLWLGPLHSSSLPFPSLIIILPHSPSSPSPFPIIILPSSITFSILHHYPCGGWLCQILTSPTSQHRGTSQAHLCTWCEIQGFLLDFFRGKRSWAITFGSLATVLLLIPGYFSFWGILHVVSHKNSASPEQGKIQAGGQCASKSMAWPGTDRARGQTPLWWVPRPTAHLVQPKSSIF